MNFSKLVADRYAEVIDLDFSKIQENKNNEVNPRSHG